MLKYRQLRKNSFHLLMWSFIAKYDCDYLLLTKLTLFICAVMICYVVSWVICMLIYNCRSVTTGCPLDWHPKLSGFQKKWRCFYLYMDHPLVFTRKTTRKQYKVCLQIPELFQTILPSKILSTAYLKNFCIKSFISYCRDRRWLNITRSKMMLVDIGVFAFLQVYSVSRHFNVSSKKLCSWWLLLQPMDLCYSPWQHYKSSVLKNVRHFIPVHIERSDFAF